MANNLLVHPSRGLSGNIRPPGDKSISHRAFLFAALARGTSRVRRALVTGDCAHSLMAAQALGCEIERRGGEVLIHSPGRASLKAPVEPIDCGRSGTTMRLLCGMLAARPFSSVLTADPQLAKRPMARVVDPLRTMQPPGIQCREERYAPIHIEGGVMTGVEYVMPVASAQVKSAMLLAGLDATGVTAVIEPGPARDHTERMLSAQGVDLRREPTEAGDRVSVHPPVSPLKPIDMVVPADPSSAAFWAVAASVVPGSDIWLEGVCVNPTRDGALRVLGRMGADIERHNVRDEGGEPVADLRVRYAQLRGVHVGGEEIVTLIDELPVIAVAAAVASGETVVTDAQELRVKETDRIASTAAALNALGAQVRETPDGWVIRGGGLKGGRASSAGDHRIAMALAVAGLVCKAPTAVEDFACAADSYPGFVAHLNELGASADWER